MAEDSTSTLLRGAKHFFSGTMLSRISGLLRDMAMAFAFGTQETVAAFLMAFRFAHLLRRLLGEGAMQSAFIPLFEKLRLASPERAGSFFVDLTASIACFLIGIIALGMAGCGICIAFGLVSESNSEVLTYTLIMLPSLLFICLFGLNAALLQCAHHYFMPSIAPVLFNVVWIAGALLLADIPIKLAMPWLSGFIILACACQWAVTLPTSLLTLQRYAPAPLRKKINLFSADIRLLAGPLLMAIIGVSAAQFNNALDVIFARYASAEGPAYLWYAIRLQQLPLALCGIALSGALLPPLTRALKSNDIPRFRHFLGFALRRSIALMLPLTAGILLLGGASIQLLYGYGDFHQDSIAATTQCLWGYGVGLLPMTIVLILAPAFYAQENFRTPTKASLAAMGINIGLNSWFVMGMQLGAPSVAWATSLSAAANMLLLGFALKAHCAGMLNADFFKSVAKSALATSAGTLGVMALAPMLPHATAMETLLYLCGQTAAFAALFFSAAYMLNAQDILGSPNVNFGQRQSS